MQLPIVITSQGRWPRWAEKLGFRGYPTHEKVWQWGKAKVIRTGQMNKWGYEIIDVDYSKVKCEVYVSHWVLSLPYLPYRFANWLWRERFADKYQAGYAAGMKEALTNPAAAQAFAQLNPAERAALLDLES